MKKDVFSGDDLKALFEVGVPTKTEFELVTSELDTDFCDIPKDVLSAIHCYVASYNGFLDHQITNSYYRLAGNHSSLLDSLPEWLDVDVLRRMAAHQVMKRRNDRASLIRSRKAIVDKAIDTTVATMEQLITELASMKVAIRVKKDVGMNTLQICDLMTESYYTVGTVKSSISNIFD